MRYHRTCNWQRNVTEDLLSFADKLLKKLENTYFKKAVQKELGANVWFNVQYAVLNYAVSEQEYILQLEEVLRGVNTSLKDFELLTLMKIKGNEEFHGNELETQARAKERLQITREVTEHHMTRTLIENIRNADVKEVTASAVGLKRKSSYPHEDERKKTIAMDNSDNPEDTFFS
ncbi:2727_t:CDS:2, partial [Funneliformis geosporum]